MSLAYKFRRAERILKKMDPGDKDRLLHICRQIQDAQAALLAAAGQQMQRCLSHCEGICCRNIEIDPIISHWDLVFVISLAPQIRSQIRDSLIMEDPLYRTDCVFLENGRGPCMFPENMRPEVCVVSFCQNDRPLRREIREVKRRFFQLTWFVRWRKARAHLHTLTRAVAAARSRFDNTA